MKRFNTIYQRANIKFHDAKLRSRPYIYQAKETARVKAIEFKEYSKQTYENQKQYIKSGEYKQTASSFKSLLMSLWTRTQNSFLQLTSNEAIKETMHKTSESLIKANEKMKIVSGGRINIGAVITTVKNTLKRWYQSFDYHVLSNFKSKQSFVMFINRQKSTLKRFFDKYRDMDYQKKKGQPFDKWYMRNRDKFTGMVVYNAVMFFNRFRSLVAFNSKFQDAFNTSIRPIMRSDKLRNAFINARTTAKIKLYMLANSPMWRNTYSKSRAMFMRMFGASDETGMLKQGSRFNFFGSNNKGFFRKVFGWGGYFRKAKRRAAYRIAMIFGALILVYSLGKGVPGTVKDYRLRKKEIDLENKRVEVDKMRLELEKEQLAQRN